MDLQTLEASVKTYLYNRKDLDASITTFIELAEAKIFREIRVPENEAIFTDQAPEDNILASIPQPADFLEMKYVLVNEKPVERISDRELKGLLAIDEAPGEPSKFARILNDLVFWRVPDSNYTIELYYWQDLTGNLTDPTDTNKILTAYPDLYLYGVLVEAMPFLVDDARAETWKAMYRDAMDWTTGRAVEQEFSGSPVSVSSMYPDPLRGHERGRGTNF